jgi:hypothetical protein
MSMSSVSTERIECLLQTPFLADLVAYKNRIDELIMRLLGHLVYKVAF